LVRSSALKNEKLFWKRFSGSLKELSKSLEKYLFVNKILPYFALPKKEHKQQKNLQIMSRVCQITGKKPIVGNHVSHSNIKSKRWFLPNIQEKRFFIPEENRWITLKVSAKGIKIINKRGIYAIIQEARKAK